MNNLHEHSFKWSEKGVAMFQNEISEKLKEDIKNECEEVWEYYCQKEKNYLLKSRPFESAYRIVLWLKYYRQDYTSFDNMLKSFMNPFPYEITKEEYLDYKKEVINILCDKYKITIKSLDPVVFNSCMPFEKL